MSKNLLDYVGLGHFLDKIKTLFVTALGTSGNNLTWTKNGETSTITIPYATEASKLSILQTKIYENILRNNATYSSPYTNSYLYFGSVKTTNQALPSHVKYRVLAYAPSNASFQLESIVEWYFGNSGIFKGCYVWNNLSSASYYPFYCHTLFSAKTAAIATSDGSYLGCYYGTSNSYGQSASTVARTIKIEILECNNCTVSLLDNIVWLNNVDNVPANLKQPSTSKAYNDTNFTANNVVTSVGLQETGDANTNTIGYQLRTNSYSKPMKAALGYGYRLLFTSADQLGWVPANTSTSSNATAARTPCTEPIDPFGEIVYYAGTAAVAVDSRPGVTSLWQQYTITFGYSFNTTGAALTLTSWKPVYIKCTPQTNGSAIIQEYTQDLPTTEDGYIYIYLGVAYSATAVELVFNHPVYYYKNGAIRLWTNEQDSAFTTSAAAGITSANITSWSGKQDAITDLATIRSGASAGATAYQKPSGGIPSTDLASAVQTSLGKADSALQSHQDISGKENISNKVTSLSSSSTDTQYPSAKCVYNLIKDNCVFIEGNDTYLDF